MVEVEDFRHLMATDAHALWMACWYGGEMNLGELEVDAKVCTQKQMF
jgi:hypothetical protein